MAKQVKRKFYNTGKSTATRQFVYSLIGIISLEYIIAGVVIYFLAPTGWTLRLVVALLLSLLLLAAYGFTRILRSAHIITEDQLLLRMGHWFSCRLPLALISAVERQTLTEGPKPDMLGVTCLREGETLFCLSRPGDICKIELARPVMVKAPAAEDSRNRRGPVRKILLNADKPEAFRENINQIIARQKKTAGGEDAGAARERDKNSALEQVSRDRVIFEIQTAGRAPLLQFDNLTRYYGDFPAVKNFNLKVYPGEIFGFLGANGAGKTTTIRMVTGLLKPSAGKVLFKGKNLWQPGAEIRRLIGYVPDTPLLYERLTAKEHLMVAGRLYDLPRETLKEKVEALLSKFELEHWENQLLSTYSMGMRRKFSLALALLPDPDLIIIDELTGAFDAPTLAQIKDILIELQSRGKTIFLSTHVMDVAEKICDRLAIIHRGELRAQGTVNELSRFYRVEGGLEPLFLKIVTGREREQ